MNFKSIKKRLVLIMALVLVVSSFGATFGATNFSDLSKAEWAAPTIQKWTGYDLVAGYKDGTFRPNANITRAEFAVIAYNAFNLESNGGIDFDDVKASDWYYTQVVGMAKLGYIKGYTDGTFKPNTPITRAEAAAIIAGIQGLTANEEGSKIFLDYEAIPTWARGHVGASAMAKFITGYFDATYRANNTITRAETVAMMNNAVYGANYFATSWRVIEKGVFGGTTEKPVTVKGNVYIKSADVELKNVIIEGKLTIGVEVGEGEVSLNNVVVKGDTNVYGGGANSVKINGGSYGKVFIMKSSDKPVRLLSVNVKGLDVVVPEKSQNVSLILEGVFNKVSVLAANTEVKTQGTTTIQEMDVQSTAINVELTTAEGTVIAKVIVEVKLTVLGQGRIVVAEVTVKEVTFEKKPETTNTTIDGKTTTETGTTPPPTSGGGNTTPPETPSTQTKDYAFKMVKGSEVANIGNKVYPVTEQLSFTLLSTIFEMAKNKTPEWMTSYSNFISEMLLEETTGGKKVAESLALRVKAYVTSNTQPALAVFNDAGMSAIVDDIIANNNAGTTELNALIAAITNATLDEFVSDIEKLYPADSDVIPPSFSIKILNADAITDVPVNQLRSTLLTAYSGKTIDSVLGQPLLTLVRVSDNSTVVFKINIWTQTP